MTIRSHRRVFGLATVAALMVLVAGCGTPSSSKKPTTTTSSASANTLNWFGNAGTADWPNTLDPAIVTDSVSIYNIDLMNANLVKANYPNLNFVGDLASHWTTSANHKVWTFYIRPNAKFGNGDDVTAEDAAWSITRSLLPATKSPVATTYLGHIVGAGAVAAGNATTVSGLKVINKKTLQITLDQPIAFFLGTLSYPTADVLDKRVMQGKPAAGYLTNTCSGNVGAGPFMPVCRNKSTGKSSFYPSGHTPYINYKPNPYYYGKKPTIHIHAPIIPTTDENYKDYLGGQVDVTGVPTPDLAAAQKKPGFVKKAQLETDYITPNSQIAPFNNVHCRLAVAYAIDRNDITQKLLHGIEGPLYDVLPPGLLGYFSNGKANGVPYYNPTKAKQELAMCPGHLSNAVMTYQNTSSDLTHEYDAVKADMQAIGAHLTLKPLTFNAWLKVVGQNMNATKSQENITENLWIDDYPDPQDWLANLLHSGANYDIGGYSNPQFDHLVDKGDTSFNNSQRAKDYIQAQKLVLNDGGWIGVGYAYGVYLINPKVHGLVATASGVWPNGNDWSNVTISR